MTVPFPKAPTKANFNHFAADGIKWSLYEVNSLQMKNNAFGTQPVQPRKLAEAINALGTQNETYR